MFFVLFRLLTRAARLGARPGKTYIDLFARVFDIFNLKTTMFELNKYGVIFAIFNSIFDIMGLFCGKQNTAGSTEKKCPGK
jgi:hypothetical protein